MAQHAEECHVAEERAWSLEHEAETLNSKKYVMVVDTDGGSTSMCSQWYIILLHSKKSVAKGQIGNPVSSGLGNLLHLLETPESIKKFIEDKYLLPRFLDPYEFSAEKAGRQHSSDLLKWESASVQIEKEAWKLHSRSIMDYCGTPIGTLAAANPADKLPLNYDQNLHLQVPREVMNRYQKGSEGNGDNTTKDEFNEPPEFHFQDNTTSGREESSQAVDCDMVLAFENTKTQTASLNDNETGPGSGHIKIQSVFSVDCDLVFESESTEAQTACFDDNSSGSISKAQLEKAKNDKELYDKWVQCDRCEKWQHYICGLYNKERDQGEGEYICSKCRLIEIEEEKWAPQAVLAAKDLPRTNLSDPIEQRLRKANGLVVRVVLSVDKELEVKQQFRDILKEKIIQKNLNIDQKSTPSNAGVFVPLVHQPHESFFIVPQSDSCQLEKVKEGSLGDENVQKNDTSLEELHNVAGGTDIKVTTLSRIAQGTQNVDPNSVNATQIGSIKRLISSVDWEKLRRESKQNEEQNSIEENYSAAISSEQLMRKVLNSEYQKFNGEYAAECQLLTFSETCLAWTSIGAEEDSFGKDEIGAVHTRNRIQEVVGAAQYLHKRSGSMLPSLWLEAKLIELLVGAQTRYTYMSGS
ncbi:histone acetyltransferase HAC1-like protein isoform X1 [Tanacetum coccineum]